MLGTTSDRGLVPRVMAAAMSAHEARRFGKTGRAAFALGAATAFLALTANAQSQVGAETLDQTALASARAPASTLVGAGQVADRYGAWLQATLQKFPDLKGTILSLDGAFFNRQLAPEANRVLRFADGTEVLLMSGCRNMSLCGETGYLLGVDFAHRQVAIVEVESAAPPKSYRFAGSREPTLRALLLEQGSKVFAKAAPDPDATKLRGVKVSAATRAMPNLFQAKPDLKARIRRVYPAADSLIDASDICGIMMADGRLLTLISAQTSKADGEVPHAIVSDDKTQQTFVYRAEGQLGREAWFGDPEGALRTVLSVGAGGCTILRGKLGLDPNGQETALAAPAASAPPRAANPPQTNAPPAGKLECRARNGGNTVELFLESAMAVECPGSLRTSSGAGLAVQAVRAGYNHGVIALTSTGGKGVGMLSCDGAACGSCSSCDCPAGKKQLQFQDGVKWQAALVCE